MPYGIHELTLNAVIDAIRPNGRVKKLILFGKRVSGEYTEADDIELAVVGKTLTPDDYALFERKLEALPLPGKANIYIVHLVTDLDMIRDIRNTGMLLYEIPENRNKADKKKKKKK